MKSDSVKPRVLFVTHRVPFPPDRGDRIRTWNVLKFLAQRADVDLISLTDEPVSDTTYAELERVTRRMAIAHRGGLQRYAGGIRSALCGRSLSEGFFDSQKIRQIIRQWNSDCDYHAAIASSSGMAPLVLPPVLRTSGRVWIDLMDVDSQKWLDYSTASRFPMSAVYGLEGRRLRKLETRIARQADRLLVVTEAERELFHAFCSDAPVQSIGNGVDLEYFAPAAAQTEPFSCVFVGVMDYRPNVDAVNWFAHQVFPQLRDQFPGARFNIVGKSPTTEVRALEQIDGIHVTGSVPDVRPWLHKAACVVVPLRIARGVQNKILEAMACGRAVVSSPAPLQGLNVEIGLHLLAAESPADWIKQISNVLEDSVRADDLGIAANAWVQIHHRWETCLEPLIELTERGTRTRPVESEVLP